MALDPKATITPFPEMPGRYEGPSGWKLSTPGRTLTRLIPPLPTLARKTSGAPLLSPGTRLGAADTNATAEPSALMAGAVLAPPGTPLGGWSTRRVEFPGISRMNTSVSGFWSAPVVGRLVASEAKATFVPSALIDGW